MFKLEKLGSKKICPNRTSEGTNKPIGIYYRYIK